MKKIIKGLFLGLTLLHMIWLSGCGATGNAKAEFWVRGNCNMCQDNIETALNAVDGVANASYDLEKHLAVVAYDSSKVKVADLHTAVSRAGYHTELVDAEPAAYQGLAKCCKKPEDM